MKGKILIIEDDPVNLDVLTRYIQRLGYDARGAVTAEAAIHLAEREAFDAILLDNVLPGMTGLQAIGPLKRSSSATIFLMTGHMDEEFKKDARLLGGDHFLAKPLDFEELGLHLHSLIDAA